MPGALAEQGHRVHRAADDHADRPRVDDLVVDEEPGLALSAAGEAADQGQAGHDLLGALDEGVDGERVRVGEQHPDHVLGRALRQADDHQAVVGLEGLQPEGLQPGSGQDRRPGADRGGLLDALARRDHPVGAAAQHGARVAEGHRVPCRPFDLLGVRPVDEHAQEIGSTVQGPGRLPYGLFGRADEIGPRRQSVPETSHVLIQPVLTAMRNHCHVNSAVGTTGT